jgi:hypothetical protein
MLHVSDDRVATTMAAYWRVPLAVRLGAGELRRPLGVAIIGGLIFGQLSRFFTAWLSIYLDPFSPRAPAWVRAMKVAGLCLVMIWSFRVALDRNTGFQRHPHRL